MSKDMAQVLLAPLLVALAICHTAAQGTPPPAITPPPSAAPPNAAAQGFLEAHNQARAEVGVGPLMWSDSLAKSTSLLVRYQRDKMGCKFANLNGSKYGGNQLWTSSRVTPPEAVEVWVKEKINYNHANNSCTAGHDDCGVYTQVVWRKSLELGCAQATCQKDQSTLTICFYNPPGNYKGESPY